MPHRPLYLIRFKFDDEYLYVHFSEENGIYIQKGHMTAKMFTEDEKDYVVDNLLRQLDYSDYIHHQVITPEQLLHELGIL
jgi:hypothetical protein